MKVILTMAVSANGMIATKDGSENFLSHGNWLQFVSLAKKTGCFIYGRKTYEAVIKWESKYMDELKAVNKVVVSRSAIIPKAGFARYASPEDAISNLKLQGFTQVVIAGGATINSEFAKRGLIDEVIFYINAVMIGEGIPIFKPTDISIKLGLLSSEKVDSDILELKYKVIK